MRRVYFSNLFGALVLASAALVCSSANAQLALFFLSLSGYVRDGTDQHPIAGAKVELLTEAGASVDSVGTGKDGDFRFTGMQKGRYVLITEFAGYKSMRENIELSVDSVAGHVIFLAKPSAPPGGAKEPSVDVRELALPHKAQDALHKGLNKLYDQGDFAGSIPEFALVIELAPDYYEAYYYTGLAYLFERKFTESEEPLRKAINLSRGSYSLAYMALSRSLFFRSRYVEAEQSARRGVELDPSSWQGHLELARALLALNRPQDAEKSALEAKKLKPDFPDLYISLANIHIQLGNNPAVREEMETYLRLAPDGPYSERARQTLDALRKAEGHPRPE
jgi:Tfp pilus assembly protein PilF